MAEVFDFVSYKQCRDDGFLTYGECIEELQLLKENATPRQNNALNFAINLIVNYLRGVDDGK